MNTRQTRQAIVTVAVFEAFKGLVAFAAASGLLLLIHNDLHGIVVRLVEHAHLNPAAKYPRILIDAATHLQDTRLTMLAVGAIAYSVIRFVESYGLFREAAWAEVLAAASGAVYIPFEVVALMRGASGLGFGALVLNIAVVVVMVLALWHRRRPPAGNAV